MIRYKTIIYSFLITLLSVWFLSTAYSEGRTRVNSRVVRNPEYLLGKPNNWSDTQTFPRIVFFDGTTMDTAAVGGGGGGGSGVSWFGAGGINDTVTAGETVWAVGKQGIDTIITKTASGVTITYKADNIHAQVSAWGVSGATNWEGVPTVHDDKVDAINGIVVGDGAGNYVSGTTKVEIASLAAGWTYAVTGSSTFVVSPYDFTMTGVSLFGPNTATAGASVYVAGALGVVPDTAVGDQQLISVSGSGSSVYSASGTTAVSAGKMLRFDLTSIATAGASVWTVQVFGTKD